MLSTSCIAANSGICQPQAFTVLDTLYQNSGKINKNSYIIDVGSNDGVALKPFKDRKYKNILGIEPAKNLAKLANKNKIKTFNGFLETKNLSKIKKNADLILASNVFAHSDELRTFRSV